MARHGGSKASSARCGFNNEFDLKTCVIASKNHNLDGPAWRRNERTFFVKVSSSFFAHYKSRKEQSNVGTSNHH
jgi:hypothetical protein